MSASTSHPQEWTPEHVRQLYLGEGYGWKNVADAHNADCAARQPQEWKGTKYVCGFMFNARSNEVLLVRKQRPEWQRGKLNGVGGHVESNEDSCHAMMREFYEETGIKTIYSQWNRFCEMGGVNNDGEDFQVVFFWTVGNDISNTRASDEPLEIIALQDITPIRSDTVGNLSWLISMARDFAAGLYPPKKAVVRYGPSEAHNATLGQPDDAERLPYPERIGTLEELEGDRDRERLDRLDKRGVDLGGEIGKLYSIPPIRQWLIIKQGHGGNIREAIDAI